ncbi:MAG TPA: FAD-binding oxidoreductase [Solirubrobacteraceae bacterium]|nr:FAD-binding oxidoreductase [Solirubrobacteraceae bacterium]
MAPWDPLQAAIAGEVILPGTPAYESARKPAIARFHDVRPAAVVRCTAASDVAEALAFARRFGLPIAARSGGHCFAGRSSTDGVVIDVGPLRSVSMDGGVATVGAGARLGDVYDALAEQGRTIAAGCGPEVGIAGLTLGGGLGLLGRAHGLTSDQLLAAEVVLADGRVVVCDEQHDEELFWALRGAGGGSFGVVTSFDFRTLRVPAATSFHLVWPLADAAVVVDAWQDWAPVAPDRLAASVLVTAAAAADQPPVVHVFGAMVGGEEETAELLGELHARVRVDPASERRVHLPYRETKGYLAEHGPGDDGVAEPHPYSKSEYFRRPLPTGAIAALVRHVADGRVPGQARELDFSPWGGAYNRVPADATAFVHRDERFLLKHAVTVDAGASSAEREAARGWLARSWQLAHPWGTGRAYQNFPDPDLDDAGAAYYGTNHERLLRAKARYDPDEVFRLLG